MNKAVFLDKDGTLIKNVPYNVDPGLVSLEEYAGEALSVLKKNDYLLIVISNQSGIANGFFTEYDLEEINVEIQYQLLPYHVQVDEFYYCPHLPEGVVDRYAVECDCRKPKPGLLLKAANDLNIDMSQSWMIGDILNDVEAGNNAGCRTILIDNGNETQWLMNENRAARYVVKDLCEAAEAILREESLKSETYDKHVA